MDFKEYIKELDRLYHVGNTTEHSFRGALAAYLQTILKNFVVTNEPRRIDCGAPDYVITLKSTPVAFIEAKDIDDRDLDGRREHKAQFGRYKDSLDRIVFTDYLDFHMYIGGEFADSVRIAETKGDHIVAIPENEAKFTEMILHLATQGRQRITSSATLARQMAAKAHLLAEVVRNTLTIDGEDSDSEMAAQLRAFRDVLIHDLKADEFADIYAQTIVYGMFTARLYDETPQDFTRKEAAELIPKSNPFLRRVFQSIAGYDIDASIEWIVDDLASMFEVTDAARIMANYGSNKRHSDPIVHFYEDFLAEYDPRLRKSRGVWYTPASVVKFIVKSVDEILQTEFGLPMGLADSSTIKVKRAIHQSSDKRTADGMKHQEVDVHRVQILDPATGTGTFLAEVIQQVRDKFDGLEGLWPSYVEKNLIPRLHGFEILMASYTIAHLKLALTLKNTGYEGQSDRRLNVFLTNSLEEATPRATNLFAKWLSDEADAASQIKTETPVMICIGNPPYSISSQNSGKWITDLVGDYKKYLNERNIQPLSDDYIKFIRLGQYYVNKNGEGVLAYISNNGFLDGIIHRQMRKSLLEEFDKIYILNLHGNSRRKEVAPDGSADENVFDIMQGVSVNLFVKTGKKGKGELGKVFYTDLYGSRAEKYDFLFKMSYSCCPWEELILREPNYFFVKKDLSAQLTYEEGFPLEKMFILNTSGIVTGRDSEYVSMEPFKSENNHIYCYRPFDIQYVNYSTELLDRPREKVMKHMLTKNPAIVMMRKQQNTKEYKAVFMVDSLTDKNYFGFQSYVFPLYLFNEKGEQISNITEEFEKDFNAHLGFDASPEEIYHYVYAVLHSPTFRKQYEEFLIVDFPRIPYPKDVEQFKLLVEKGAQLRKLHLLEGAASWPNVVSFPVAGTNTIDRVVFEDGKVFINETQYFGNVSELAWTFYIGGYQPAQKWLKDRKSRTMDYTDILHYGHIIHALQQTDLLMKEIDAIGVL